MKRLSGVLFLFVLCSGFCSVDVRAETEVKVEYHNKCNDCGVGVCQEWYIYTKVVDGEELWRKVWRNCDDNSGLWEDTGWTSVNMEEGSGGLPSFLDTNGHLHITVSSGDGGVFTNNPLGSGLVFSGDGSSTVLVPSSVLAL